MVRCHYEVMGLGLDATPTEVKKAYRELAMQFHPDKNIGDEARAESSFKELSAAYEVLSDHNARVHYNEILTNKYAEGSQGQFSTNKPNQDPQRNPRSRKRSRDEDISGYEGYFFFQPEDQTEQQQQLSYEYFERNGHLHGEFMTFCRRNKFGYVRPSTDIPYDVHAMNCILYKAGCFCIYRAEAENPDGFVSPPRPQKCKRGWDVEREVELTLEEFFHGATKFVQVYAGDIETVNGTQEWYKMITTEIEPGSPDKLRKRFRSAIKSTEGVTCDVVITAVQVEHEHFRRMGNDLVYEMPHYEWSNSIENRVSITGVNGKYVAVDTPSGSEQFARCVVKGAGMPCSVGSSERGDLIVKFSRD